VALLAAAAAAVLLAAPPGGPAPAAAQEAGDGGHHAAHHGPPDVAIVIHGGAGSIREIDMTEDEEEAYRSAMTESLRAGRSVLEDGGSSVDACVRAIQVMERSPLFNAGVGAVFTSEGTVEHDASLMDGRTRNSGAVAGVRHVSSPIALARLVMDSSRHVMFAREGAETFAEQHGMEMVPNESFYTEERKRRWEERQREQATGGPRAPAAGREDPPTRVAASGAGADHLGTVGCAALDRNGDLAAGTSTGGTSNKRWGRIGDSPIVGAGTYADNETAAVSATGYGEFFIRGVVAHDIASMMRYAGLDVASAASAVIHGRLEALGAEATGGVIALDREGNVAAPFNTPGMFRGWIGTDGEMVIRFYRR
jgi:beta-aspartyl-peptidase (threonine type)